MIVTELKFDEKKQSEVYNGLPYPHCKMYEDLEIIYSGSEVIVERISGISEKGKKSTSHTTYRVFHFQSEIGNIYYKFSYKISNKFVDTISSHINIPGVKYRIKAVISRDSQIQRVIRIEKLTRNPESCK